MLEVHAKPLSTRPSDVVVGGINLVLYPDPFEIIKQSLLDTEAIIPYRKGDDNAES